jgi:Uma2 family endonuclease
MNVHARRTMTFEEYESWRAGQERKFELDRGEPRMSPFVRLEHNRIALRTMVALEPQLDRSRFELVNGDFAIRTAEDSARFADVAVIAAGGLPTAGYTTDPVLVVEILSPSSVHNDFGEKRYEYMALSSLQAYLVLAQDKPEAWLWLRDEKGDWPKDPVLYEGREGEIVLPPVGAILAMGDIYRA